MSISYDDNHYTTGTSKWTNYIKVKVDNAQQNSKNKLCGNRDETVNHMSESSKLMRKEYNTSHDWVEEGDPLKNV